MKRRLGFTLVELVIVIAVIGILATVLVPTFGAIIDKANHSTDVQTAGNLTTLVAMYAVENPIECEADIAAAINEGKNDPNFYANLKPKSAKQGYCFWYDYNEGKVIVERAEDLGKVEDPSAQVAADWNITMSAEPRTGKTFNGGMRELVEGYILMGSGGNNELLTLVNNLEKATDVGAYTDALKAINDADSTKAGIEKLKELANSTVIHNDFGAFAPNGTIANVHIPQGTEKLSNDVYVDEILEDVTIVLPKGAKVAGASLGYLDAESCTLKVKVPAEDLPQIIEPSAIAATIVVANGDAYLQDTDVERDPVDGVTALALINCFRNKNNFDDVVGGERITENLDALLHSYALAYNPVGQEKLPYPVYVDTVNKFIYISNGKIPEGGTSEDFQIVAGSFSNKTGGSAACGMFKWTLTYADGNTEVLSNATKVITINSNVKFVEVTSLSLTYKYEVKPADVEKVDFAEMEGKKFSFGGAFDLIYKNFGEGETKKNILSWTINPQIVLTGKIPNEQIDVNQVISVDKAVLTGKGTTIDWFKISYNENKDIILEVKEEAIKELSGDKQVDITFKCGDTKKVTKTINLIDVTSAVFDIASNVNTLQEYNFKPVVGTVNKIQLQYLFTPENANVGRQKVYLTLPWEADPKVLTMNPNGLKEGDVTIPYWATYEVQIPEGTSGNKTLSIKAVDGAGAGVAMELTLDVVNGAYNVCNDTDWAAAVTYQGENANTSIAIIAPVNIPGTDSSTEKSSTDVKNKVTTHSAKYLMNVGSGTVYGNFNAIKVPDTFKLYRTYPNNYLICLNGGKLYYVIIDGPDYGTAVCIDDGDATDKGTYVGAVKADAGTVTIENCFLSGFRSPLWANGGTINLTKTTLHKGNFANIYVDSVSTINVTNVTTIQYESETGNVGAGVFVKHNSGTGHKIKGTGFEQKNWVNTTQINAIAAYAAGFASAEQGSTILFDVTKHLGKIEAISHTVDDETQYNAGIFMLRLSLLWGAKKYYPTLDVSELYDQNGNKFFTTPKPVEESLLYGALTVGVQISGESTESCKEAHDNKCTHEKLPINTQAHLDDFLAKY